MEVKDVINGAVLSAISENEDSEGKTFKIENDGNSSEEQKSTGFNKHLEVIKKHYGDRIRRNLDIMRHKPVNSDSGITVHRLTRKYNQIKEKQREDAEPTYDREQITPGQHSVLRKNMFSNKDEHGVLKNKIEEFVKDDDDSGFKDKIKKFAKKVVDDHPLLPAATTAGLAAKKVISNFH